MSLSKGTGRGTVWEKVVVAGEILWKERPAASSPSDVVMEAPPSGSSKDVVMEAPPSVIRRSEEGVNTSYTCSECEEKTQRSVFFITGDPAYDWQGRLPGLCYNCFRGRGPWTKVDRYEDVIKKLKMKGTEDDETKLLRRYKNECKALHNQRSDVKKADLQRLRSANFDRLMAEMALEYPGESRTKVYKAVMTFVRAVCHDIVDTFCMEPRRKAALLDIFKIYEDVKEAEAKGDDLGIIQPGGPLGDQTQWLSKIADHTWRWFICRFRDCGYFGRNTDWISTAAAGGWKFMCPACGQPYKAGATGSHLLKVCNGRFFCRGGSYLEAGFGRKISEPSSGLGTPSAMSGSF
jgi:hypothetical protein